jgi:CheY-like chemotaxis protein
MNQKILLVDDTKTVIMSERMMLSGQGYRLAIATNGKEALASVAEERPDLVLLDIVMPEMTGLECLATLKNDERTSDIPIIMVTTRGEEQHVAEAYALGCDDYLTKPLDKMELLTKIRSLLR